MSIDAKSVQPLKNRQLQEEKNLESMASGRLNGFVPIAPARPSAHRESNKIELKSARSKGNHSHDEHSLSPIMLAKSLSLSAIPDKPITIRTSKNWVLPPRPKPGRKPSLLKNKKKKERKHTSKKKSSKKDVTTGKLTRLQVESTIKAEQKPQEIRSKVKRERQVDRPKIAQQVMEGIGAKKEHKNNTFSTKLNKLSAKKPARSLSVPSKTNIDVKCVKFTRNNEPYIEVDSSLVENPIKRQILKVNEENYYLKLEVVKLMTQLKRLQSDVEVNTPYNTAAQHTTCGNIESVEVKRATSLPLVPERVEIQQNHTVVKPLIPRRRSPSANRNACKARMRRQTISGASPIKRGVKRAHVNDINDLIVSLVDLNGVDQDLTSSPTAEAVDLDRLDSMETKVPFMTKGGNESIGMDTAVPQLLSGNAPQSMDQFLNLGSKGWDTTSIQHRAMHQGSPTALSEEDDLTSTVSTTPSTMLTSVKTTDTMDSLSGTTLVSTNSHEFKLLDIPEIDSFQGSKGEKKEPSIFDDPNSLVDDSIFQNAEWNRKKSQSSVSKFGDTIDEIEQGALLEKHDTRMTNDNHYEFNGLNDVEMEFENFVNGNDI